MYNVENSFESLSISEIKFLCLTGYGTCELFVAIMRKKL